MIQPQPTQVALGVLVTHNLVQNSLLNERGYVTGNLVVSGILVALGRITSLTWEEMGLSPGELRRGVRLGGWAAGTAAGLTLLALTHPRGRALLQDRRGAVVSGGDVWRRALVRFPFGTALFEEVAFRGVLPALFRRTHRPASAETLTAAAFGLWHLIPTARALVGNPLGRDLPLRRRLLTILGGSAAAGISGLILSWMRRSTASLLAPWLAHSSFNAISYLGAVSALKSGSVRSPRCPPRLDSIG